MLPKALDLIITANDMIEVINLSRTLGHPEMLPVAFYLCAAVVPLSMLVRGIQRADGTLETFSVDDLERVLMGRDRLMSKRSHYAYAIYALEPSPACQQKQRCMAGLAEERHRVLTTEAHSKGSHVLHRMFRKQLEAAQKSGTLCADCIDAVVTRQQRLQQDVWSNLPKLFDLDVEGWPGPA